MSPLPNPQSPISNPQSPNPPIPATSPPPKSKIKNPKFLDALVILALCLLVVLFLWPAVLPGRVLMPLDLVTNAWPPWQQPNQPADVHNPLISDVVDYIYPVKQFAANAIRQGVFPLWNPYVLGGYPFTYNSQAGLFYPFSLLYYLLPGATAVDLTIFGQLFLGVTFMYLYLRCLALGRPAAAAGTLIFTFNGLMVVWLEWQVVHAAVIWLPLQLYLVERLVSQLTEKFQIPNPKSQLAIDHSQLTIANSPPSPNPPIPASSSAKSLIFNLQSPLLLSIAFALPWLGGHWNWTLYGSLTVVAYLLWRLWPWLIGRRREVWLLFIFILVMGLALCLVQVLPAANYLRQSHRQPLPFAQSLQQGLFNRFVTLLIPNFFGNPVDHNWWGPVNYNESAWYVGLLPLFLALLLPFLRRDTIARFYLTWGGLGLLWTLGTPAYGLLYILPIFNGLLPSRAAILVVFCTAVLAALALDRLLQGTQGNSGELKGTLAPGNPKSQFPNPKTVLPIAVFLLIVAAAYLFFYRSEIGWLYLRPHLFSFLALWLGAVLLLLARLSGRLAPRPFALLALALITADLFLAGYDYNTISSVDQLYPPTETGRFLQSDPEPFRIATLPEAVAYPPNTSLALPLANASGYEPGILQRVVNYIGTAEGQSAIYFERELMPLHGLSSPLIDLLNVKYVVTIADWLSDTPATGASQPQVDVWLPLTPGAPLGQSFLVPDAGLHRLDLRLRVSPNTTAPDSTLTARIFTADGRQELAHATLPAADLDPAGWHSFYFTAFPSEWGRQFRFTIEADQPGVEIGATDSDRYPDGKPLDGTAADLAFTTYYLPRPHLAHEGGKTRVYLNEGYFPRAYAVPQALVVANEAEALAALQTHSHELAQLTILELEGSPPPPSLTIDNSQLTIDNSPLPSPTITRYDLNHIELTTDLPTPAFIILADTYYPGWQATIDGRSTPLYRANSILRAVYASAGRHTLTFTFRPLDFTVAATISASAWLFTLLLLLYTTVRSDNPYGTKSRG